MPNSVSNSSRLHSIDALRGLVMLFMLLDHVRETFFLHRQVGDPMDVASTEPALFLSRTLAHLCAPVFVFLTGLSAFLYGEKHQGRRAVSAFLFKRGLFLVALELTLVNFAWTFQLPPTVIYLQVIWAIGLSMLALAALLWLPRPLLAALGVLLVAGHNLLDPLHFAPGSAWHLPWAVLHDRGWIEAGDALRLRTSYPLLPWIGVIALGYAAGNWFSGATPATTRRRYLLAGGGGLLLGFILLRPHPGNRPAAPGLVRTPGLERSRQGPGGVRRSADVLLPAASLPTEAAVPAGAGDLGRQPGRLLRFLLGAGAMAVQHPAGRDAVPGGALVRRFQGAAAGYRLVEILLRRGASRSRWKRPALPPHG